MILSILAAFAIDASWDRYQERRHAHDLMVGMLDDFRASRAGLEDRLDLARRMAWGTARLAGLLHETPAGRTVVVPDSLIMAVIGGPTYEPATNTLDAAVASGEIELLTDPTLRSELAQWRRLLADTAEDEIEVRRIVNEQLVPQLAGSLGLAPYFSNVLAWTDGTEGSGLRGEAPVVSSTDLSSVVGLRQFYADFVAADLEALLASLDRIVALLEAQVER